MTIDGVEFKQGAAIVHSVIDDLPQVAQIDTICVINGSTLVFKAEYYIQPPLTLDIFTPTQ